MQRLCNALGSNGYSYNVPYIHVQLLLHVTVTWQLSAAPEHMLVTVSTANPRADTALSCENIRSSCLFPTVFPS
jgi:hypothetical protein